MQVTVVTLIVTPDQAERLTLASTEGKIQLALRNPLDLESPETVGVRPGMLMGNIQQRPAPIARRSTSSPVRSAPVYAEPAPTVEIIRGDKRQHVNVG
jgi:pilus assembly protein CpaB